MRIGPRDRTALTTRRSPERRRPLPRSDPRSPSHRVEVADERGAVAPQLAARDAHHGCPVRASTRLKYRPLAGGKWASADALSLRRCPKADESLPQRRRSGWRQCVGDPWPLTAPLSQSHASNHTDEVSGTIVVRVSRSRRPSGVIPSVARQLGHDARVTLTREARTRSMQLEDRPWIEAEAAIAERGSAAAGHRISGHAEPRFVEDSSVSRLSSCPGRLRHHRRWSGAAAALRV